MNALEKKAIAILGSIFALRMLGLFMIIPVISIYGKDYIGATSALLGLAVGIYGLTQAIMQIPVSILADRLPRKPIIAVGLLLFALGGAVAGSADHVYGLIIGRAIAGFGAISAVAMALLSDLTREQNRNVAMATIGLSIAVAFNLAFGLGPILTGMIGFKGLFWLTSASAMIAIGLLTLLPKTTRAVPLYAGSVKQQLSRVIKNQQLNRLNFSIFVLHLLITGVFVVVPYLLINTLNMPVNHHGYLYLPLLLLGFVLAVPAIIIAEKKKRMKEIFIGAIFLILLSFINLGLFSDIKFFLVLGLGLFFIAFNVLEATLPSWLSKISPIADKATAMGFNSTSQFLGAGLGGVLAGQMLSHQLPYRIIWLIFLGLTFIWLIIANSLKQPPYLSSLTVELQQQELPQNWQQQLLLLDGIEDIVVLNDYNIAYIKVDKSLLTEESRLKLSQISVNPLEI